MAFSSSVPLYLDPPNWQQHPNNHQQQQQQQQLHNEQIQQHHFISQQQQQQQQQQQVGSIGPGPGPGPGAQQIRANSMAERARLAKIPPPEVPQKCPRCDSTNTKFCYYNNYSLSQPRHFCKTCRRYWTRGGALRNVPVGGGCRRNKRSSSSNKSSSGSGATSAKSAGVAPSLGADSIIRGINVNTLGEMINSANGNGNNNNNNNNNSNNNNPLSFMASLQNIAHLGGISGSRLNFNGGPINNIHNNSNTTTPLLAGVGGIGGGGVGGYNLEFPPPQQQQQMHQFPNFLGGFEIPGSSIGGGGLIYSQFQNVNHHRHSNNEDEHHEHHHEELNVDNRVSLSKSSNISSMVSPVKMEDNNNVQQQQQQQQQGLNLAKQLMMGIASPNDDESNNNSNVTGNNSSQFWGGNMANTGGVGVTSMWTDLSGLNSSSTSHLL